VLSTLALLATGALLEWPELRARLIGGYGTTVVTAHLWSAALFVVAPVLALALSHRPLLHDLHRRLTLRGPWPGTWRKSHIALSFAGGLVLTLSGVALWADDYVSRGVWDLSRTGHVVFTVLIAVAIPIHLFKARERMAKVLREWLGLAPPPPHVVPAPPHEAAPEQELERRNGSEG
jgi:hypothetical protein